MAKYIKVLTVFYNTKISYKDIPLFRGAVLKSMGDKANLLYHNHIDDNTFRYSYPLIQYKRLGGNAAITCVEEGADIIGQFISETPDSMMIGDKELKCEITQVHPTRILVQTWHKPFRYHISRWLPLNTKNYHLYQATTDEAERIIMLEKILIGNLLSMLKGIGIHLDELLVRINQISEPYIIYNKGIGLMAFNADFTCNLSIPNYLGIGKNASIGYGVVHQEKPHNTKTKEY